MNVRAVLAKGINFDHIFNPYRDPRQAYTDEERKGSEAALRDDEFKQAAGLGFTHVRLNLGQAFLQETRPPYRIRPAGLTLLDRALDMAAKNNLGLILDMHQIPVPNLTGDKEARQAFRALWRVLAARYLGRKQPLIFELLNEPRVEDAAAWREITLELIADIRDVDPNRVIIVSGGGWGGLDTVIELGNLKLPNLVYSFHFYDPFVFTHQGAGWAGKMLGELRGIAYPLDKDQLKAEAGKLRAEGLETGAVDDAAWGGGGKDQLKQELAPVFAFGKKEGLVLYCGEFGVHKPHAPPDSRARWIADMVSLLEGNGVPWAMWAYHAGFDLVDRSGQPIPALVSALGLRKP